MDRASVGAARCCRQAGLADTPQGAVEASGALADSLGFLDNSLGWRESRTMSPASASIQCDGPCSPACPDCDEPVHFLPAGITAHGHNVDHLDPWTCDCGRWGYRDDLDANTWGFVA